MDRLHPSGPVEAPRPHIRDKDFSGCHMDSGVFPEKHIFKDTMKIKRNRLWLTEICFSKPFFFGNKTS